MHTQESSPLTQTLDDLHSQIKLRDALVSSLQFSKILGGSRAAGVDDSSFAWIDGKVYQPRFNPRVHDEADRGAHQRKYACLTRVLFPAVRSLI